MTFKCDTVTRGELDAAVSKVAWAAVINTALGPTRQITCKQDLNPAAADPWATGTTFRKVGCSGTIVVTAGRVTSFGRIKGTVTSLPADVALGKSVMRVEGNGRWIELSLGVPNSGADVVTKTVFTATNGFGLYPDFSISGKRFLPSGTGPAAPTLDSSAPHHFEVWNWTNPAAPFLSGTATLTNRDDDFVFEDPEMASGMGDVGIYQTGTGVMHGSGNDMVEFGFTLFASHVGNTEVGNIPLYEVRGAAAVRGDWLGYPGSADYDQSKHITYPAPFKVLIKNSSGTTLYTWQMDDGSPINSGTQQYDGTHAMHPHWNCGMQLPWENTRQKMSSKANKYYPGVNADGMRPSRAKIHYTVIGVEPLLTGGYQGNSRNGLHNLWATDRMPQPNANHTELPLDPFGVVPNQFNRSGSSSENAPWADGWGWEPGSFSNHNWYTGPGGPRFDRAFIPSILALWATNPTMIRAQGNVPIKDMAYSWMKAYANHSNHWCKNPNTLQLFDDNADMMNWKLTRTYYDSHPVFGPKIINVAGDMRDGDTSYHRDKTGRFIWSGWCRDPLHSYGTAGWAALLCNSPAAAIMSKWDTFYQLAQGGGNIGRDDYMVRSMAWLWLHYTIAAKLSSTHRLGIARAQLDKLFTDHLENVYKDVYVPVFLQNERSLFADGIRNLGVPFLSNNGQNTTQGAALGYYMAGVLMLMKQTGFWSRIYAKGGHIKTVLDMHLRNMDKYCFDKTLDTPSSQWGGGGYQYINGDPVPASWAAYSSVYEPQVGSTGLFHNADGSVAGDRDVGVHPFIMYPYVRRDFFPEFPHARLAATIAKLDSEIGAVTAYVAAATTNDDKINRDHTYGYPGVAIIKAPTVLGPA